MKTKTITWGNSTITIFKEKPNLKKIALVLSLGSASFILPDFGAGLFLASCVAYPGGFKKAVPEKLRDLKYKAWGFKIKHGHKIKW